MDRSTLLLLAVVLILVVAAAAMLVRRSGRGPSITRLAATEAQRYLQEMEAVVASFVDEPEQAAARARGLVEEVMRRMGFPDRIDRRQRIRDVKGHDRDAARHLSIADTGLREHGGDTEHLRKVVQGYRDAMHRLLGHQSGLGEAGSLP
jgi:hypothetical protein